MDTKNKVSSTFWFYLALKYSENTKGYIHKLQATLCILESAKDVLHIIADCAIFTLKFKKNTITDRLNGFIIKKSNRKTTNSIIMKRKI
jgi:hypothetical protein